MTLTLNGDRLAPPPTGLFRPKGWRWYNLARLRASVALTTKYADVAQRQSNRLVSGRLWVRFPSSASVRKDFRQDDGGRPRNGNLDRYPSGQRGLTVNQMAYAFGGSNPSLSTKARRSLARPHSSGVERILGKNEVMGSIPIEGSEKEFDPKLN